MGTRQLAKVALNTFTFSAILQNVTETVV